MKLFLIPDFSNFAECDVNQIFYSKRQKKEGEFLLKKFTII